MNLTYHHCRRIFKNFYSRLTATLLSFSPLHNSTDGFSRLSLYAFLHMSTFFFCCQHRSLWTKLGILWKVFNWKRQSFDSFRNQPEYSGEKCATSNSCITEPSTRAANLKQIFTFFSLLLHYSNKEDDDARLQFSKKFLSRRGAF